MSKPSLARLLHRALWYGTTFALILAALILTAVRLLLPYAEGYRAQAEAWVSGYLGQPVRIEAMDARLLQLSPTVILRQVQLLDPVGKPAARFDEIHIGIATLASLRQRAVVMSELAVVGAQLAVERRPDGALRVEGLSLPAAGTDQARNDDDSPVGRWLFSQERLALRDSKLVWRDLRPGGQTLRFEQVALELRNDGSRHRLAGSLRLPEQLGATLTVAADVTGTPLAPGGAVGQVYFAAERVRPSGVLRSLEVERVRADSGEVDLRVWGHWNGRALVRAEGEFEARQLVVDGGEGPVALERASGFGRWQAEEQGWRLEMGDLQVTRGGRQWEPGRIALRVGSQSDYRLRADFLRVEDLAAVAALLPLDPAQRRELAQRAPSGDLHDLELVLADSRVRAQARFEDLSLRPSGKQPGFDGLDGSVWYTEGEAGVTLATHAARLKLPGLFREPLTLQRVDGSLRWHAANGRWRLESDVIHVANADIHGRVRVRISRSGEGAPYLDLSGDFHDGRAAATRKYLPTGIMNAHTVAWLDRAFLGGKVVEGGVLLHGPLDRFPFDHGEGQFQVRFTTRDVELDYMPGWPRIGDIAAEVLFEGRRIEIEARSARLLNSRIDKTTVAIQDLRHPRLSVEGQVQGPLADLFDYLEQSKMAGHIGPALAQLKPRGPSHLDLALDIALRRDPGAPPHGYRGALTLLDSGLGVAAGVDLERINGTVRFDGADYHGDGITARLFGSTVTARVSSEKARKGRGTRVELAGGLEAAVVAKALRLPLLERLAGRASWTGELHLPHAPGDESVLYARSNLVGVRSSLPAPLEKAAGTAQPLELSIWFSGARAGQLALALDRRVNGVLDLNGGHINSAAVHFGPEPGHLPVSPAVLVSGSLPHFAPGEWSGLLSSQGEGKPLPLVLDMEVLGLVGDGSGAAEAASDPRRWPPLDVRVERLTVGEARLGRVSFQTKAVPGQVLIRDLKIQGAALNLDGSGFVGTGVRPRCGLHLVIQSNDMGRLASDLGVASMVRRGRLNTDATLEWPGTLSAPDVAKLQGELSVMMQDGVIEEVDPGAGRLIGLLSLQALPQRLLLDFRDLFEKGMRFNRIQGRFEIEDGEARTDDLRMDTLPAKVLITGRTGLARRDYDQTITVIPDVAGTLPVAGGLALGPQVGAVLLLFQGLFKSQIDDAAQIRYRVTGPWDAPVIQRIGKK